MTLGTRPAPPRSRPRGRVSVGTPAGSAQGATAGGDVRIRDRRGRVIKGRIDPQRRRGPQGRQTPGAPHQTNPGAGSQWWGRSGATGHGGEPRRWIQRQHRVLAGPDPRSGSVRGRGSPRESEAGAGDRHKTADCWGGRHPKEHGTSRGGGDNDDAGHSPAQTWLQMSSEISTRTCVSPPWKTPRA